MSTPTSPFFSLIELASLVKSSRWNVVVPLPVVMVLASQFSNMSQLGNAATAALRYITSHIKSHASR